MKKKNDRPTLGESVRIHWRAAKDVHRFSPHSFPSTVLCSAFGAIPPYVTIYFSARIINELAGLRRPEVLLRWVLLTIGVTGILQLCAALLQRWEAFEQDKYTARYVNILTEKFLSMDFADIDKQRTMDLYAQIIQNANWGGWGFNYLTMYFSFFTASVAEILGAVALTFSLFTSPVPADAGKLTALNNPLSLLASLAVIVAATGISAAAMNRGNTAYSTLAESSRLGNRIFGHFRFLGREESGSSDLRMYGQLQLAESYMARFPTFGRGSAMERLERRTVGISYAISLGMTAVITGSVYVYVCLKAWAGAFGIGSVTQYVGAVTALSVGIRKMITTLDHMRNNAVFLKTAYEFLDIPNAMYQGSLTTEKRADRQYEVEFRDVSFRYPGSERYALRHVNLKFQIGKRLAIVGENGSGKTTFIKLLCRLYDPEEGQILLNGIDIRKYNYRDYMDLFSVVFQDFQLISQPLGANVAASGSYDRAKVERCLVDAGFGDRLAEMLEGLDTYLYKDFGREGVKVSGGEAQKIAIARALYKDAPFIILDEPTAALDPIAEAEIYAKFDTISGDKTAIYISHRLSSCKFCDEIVVFQNGTVIQRGTHAALVADETGKYHELWHAQAQYYTEEKPEEGKPREA